jgi:mono/diheme cytochrome c family protein
MPNNSVRVRAVHLEDNRFAMHATRMMALSIGFHRVLISLATLVLPSLCTATDNPETAKVDGPAVYARVCAECHGDDRLGRMGPALLPENLGRLKRPLAAAVIRDGRPGTQMVGFGASLSEAEIEALVNLVYSPPTTKPVWDEADIVRSRIVHQAAAGTPDRPRFSADPLNLFVVVEAGDHHATILDGDTFTPITRFATRFALHGGPKFTADGRYVFFASRDGWISKYDLWALEMVAEIRAGVHTRNVALSPDGRTVLVGNDVPHGLVVLDATDLTLVQIVPTTTAGGGTSRVSAVYQAEPRASFVVALKDSPELLELPIPPLEGSKPVRRMYGYEPFSEELLRAASPVPIRRVSLPGILDAFFFDPTYRYVVGAEQGTGHVDVIDLEAGAVNARIELPGLPHLGSGISWRKDGRLLLATPNLQRGVVTIIDAADWRVLSEIPTSGPGFFLRSHENAPDAWVDSSMGPTPDTLTLIDKQTLAVRTTLTPAPGKIANHVEFDREGRHALVSVYEDEGAVVVFDARTLKEVKRLPMRKPSGKYNVFNKISRSEGTSH